MALHRVAAAARRISWQPRYDLRPPFSPALTRRRGCFIIEAFGFFPHDPATDETFE
jgi:hypothetical protein